MTTMNANGTTAVKSAGPTPGVSAPAQEAAPREVKNWLHAGECVLIDVREPDEHARERIPGAKLLPLSRFDPQQAAAMAKSGQKVVLHCRSGRRSSDACRMAAALANAGVPVISMTGGIEAWKNDALPVEVNTKVSSISVMRQVQLVIGAFVLIGSALAWLTDPLFVAIPAFFGAGLIFAGATGTCALATVIGKMPWNRASGGGPGGGCSSGACG